MLLAEKQLLELQMTYSLNYYMQKLVPLSFKQRAMNTAELHNNVTQCNCVTAAGSGLSYFNNAFFKSRTSG